MKFCIYPAAKTQAWEQKSVGPIVRTVEGSLVWMEIEGVKIGMTDLRYVGPDGS